VYDYEATAPGELSVHEDDVLYMFYNEGDWILVQDSTTEGRAGYVPGNYIEVVDEEDPKPVPPASTRIIVPDSVSLYIFLRLSGLNFAAASKTSVCRPCGQSRFNQSHCRRHQNLVCVGN
jgi:hypothetical protein